jgi:hypothetical protein
MREGLDAMKRAFLGAIVLGAVLYARNAAAQTGLPELEVQRVVCPGDPAANLSSIDCNFTLGLRLEELVATGLTDQAAAGAVFWGAVAQMRDDPPQWDEDVRGLGSRIGIRYTQNLAKSATAFAVGALLNEDPRHLTYSADPGVGVPKNGLGPRVGHVFVDWATVRKSTESGNGRREPNYGLFAAAFVSGVAGNPWYPTQLRTPAEVGKRAVSSLATALLASAFTEFTPDLGRLLGAIAGKTTGAKKPPRIQ